MPVNLQTVKCSLDWYCELQLVDLKELFKKMYESQTLNTPIAICMEIYCASNQIEIATSRNVPKNVTVSFNYLVKI
ncbi:hypothetical protein SORBI_3007G089566 [Sorghum bicolor]|uniref:Uncharacterized protein n=1 Tax=Sorghum bicolor TaxID=4558 RepID=A0A1Z5R9P8_SORBI|nr:hypothetical protein SORBI_3007G089566 [Sorghum bicolor]